MATNNLVLGKGELWFNPFSSGTTDGTGFDFLGNCPEFTLTAETEKLDHYRSTRGIREKDQSVIIEKNVTGSIVCDDISTVNFGRFIGATTTNLAQTSATGEVETIAAPVPGRMYQLGVTAALPTGVRGVSNVVVVDSALGTTTYVATTDYIVHAELGMIEIVDGGAITAAGGIEITYDIATNTRSYAVTNQDEIEGELKFISYNAVGPRIDYFMPWVKLSPNGDFAIISEEWATLPFSVEVLRKGDLELLYADGRPVSV